MSRIDLLRKNYQRICGLPWDRNVAGPQRVWLAVYDKEDERKLRLRLGLFKEATEQVGHHWRAVDFTSARQGAISLHRGCGKWIDHRHAIVILTSIQVFTVERAATHLFGCRNYGGVPISELKSPVELDGGVNQIGRQWQSWISKPSLDQGRSVSAGEPEWTFGRDGVDEELRCNLDRPAPGFGQEELLGPLTL